MKKRILLAIFCLVLLGGCATNTQTSTPSVSPTDTPAFSPLPTQTPASKLLPFTHTFAGMGTKGQPDFSFDVTGHADDETNVRYTATKLVVRLSKNNKTLQTITPDTLSFDSNKLGLRFFDANFDGYKDILLRTHCEAGLGSPLYYKLWIWMPYSKQFKEVEDFDRIYNPVFDYKNKKVLSLLGNKYGNCSYTMYTFFGNEFEIHNQLVIEIVEEPKADFLDPNRFHYVESMSVSYELSIIQDFTSYAHPEKKDVRLDRYYAPGSYWDIDSNRWGVENNP